MELLGAKVVYPVTLPEPSKLENDGDYTPLVVNCTWPTLSSLTLHSHDSAFEIADTAKEFFSDYVDPESTIRDLSHVVNFNKQHSDSCLPKGKGVLSFAWLCVNTCHRCTRSILARQGCRGETVAREI